MCLRVSIIVIKLDNQNKSEEERVISNCSLSHMTYYYWSKSEQKVRKGACRQELKQKQWRNSTFWLVPNCFLSQRYKALSHRHSQCVLCLDDHIFYWGWYLFAIISSDKLCFPWILFQLLLVYCRFLVLVSWTYSKVLGHCVPSHFYSLLMLKCRFILSFLPT